jgi:16S rRNA (uracil1498-N3)-methyltransferase
MQIFYAPDIAPPLYELSEEESRHCVRVLRLGVGDEVRLVDGRGGLYTARITEAGRRCLLSVTGVEHGWGRRGYGLTMAVAPTKNTDRYEWFLEKATEIGVDVFVPLLTDRSERRAFKPERAERIITSAVKQSLKAYRPVLEPLTPFAELVKRPFDGAKLIAHCAGEDGVPPGMAPPLCPTHKQSHNTAITSRLYISDCVTPGQNVLILIGPEGDFSAAEIELARTHGFIGISLGEARLRTETAALHAVIETAILNR